MCFTPTISLTIWAIEFILATVILLFFKRTLLNKLFTITIYLLGTYQFTQYMLCSFDNPIVWAKLGWIAYTFLPALGLHMTLNLSKPKFNAWKLYLSPTIFSLIALFSDGFVLNSQCGTLFVSVNTQFTNLSSNLVSSMLYLLYYSLYILLAISLAYFALAKEKVLFKKKMYKLIMAALFFSLVPALVLMVAIPSLYYVFPSMYCAFALIFSLIAFIGAYLEDRHSISN